MVSLQEFCTIIIQFYGIHGRRFAWRQTYDPYAILVSEIMLQQTQTYRVEPKYEQFLAVFPTIHMLAEASLKDVLGVWQGLGYNRRGKHLHETAQKIVQDYSGRVPDDSAALMTLPGIGAATAASIPAFAYNKPTVFIETNIRAVFIHFFFQDEEKVSDKKIMPLVAQTVNTKNPREWYYALMDYGVMLKKQLINPSRKSAHHTKQSKFVGSDRQIRGAIIRILTKRESVTKTEIFELIRCEPGIVADNQRIENVLSQLSLEKLIIIQGENVSI